MLIIYSLYIFLFSLEIINFKLIFPQQRINKRIKKERRKKSNQNPRLGKQGMSTASLIRVDIEEISLTLICAPLEGGDKFQLLDKILCAFIFVASQRELRNGSYCKCGSLVDLWHLLRIPDARKLE